LIGKMRRRYAQRVTSFGSDRDRSHGINVRCGGYD
jgi:hypothetical protein